MLRGLFQATEESKSNKRKSLQSGSGYRRENTITKEIKADLKDRRGTEVEGYILLGRGERCERGLPKKRYLKY